MSATSAQRRKTKARGVSSLCPQPPKTELCSQALTQGRPNRAATGGSQGEAAWGDLPTPAPPDWRQQAGEEEHICRGGGCSREGPGGLQANLMNSCEQIPVSPDSDPRECVETGGATSPRSQ